METISDLEAQAEREIARVKASGRWTRGMIVVAVVLAFFNGYLLGKFI